MLEPNSYDKFWYTENMSPKAHFVENDCLFLPTGLYNFTPLLKWGNEHFFQTYMVNDSQQVGLQNEHTQELNTHK